MHVAFSRGTQQLGAFSLVESSFPTGPLLFMGETISENTPKNDVKILKPFQSAVNRQVSS